MVCEPDFLFQALVICDQCELSYKSSKNQRLHVEISLIRLCNLQTQKKNLNPERPALDIPDVAASATSSAAASATPLTGPSAVPASSPGSSPAPATVVAEQTGSQSAQSPSIEKQVVSTEPDQDYHMPPRISIKDALRAGVKAEIPVSATEDSAGVPTDPENTKQSPVTQELLIECWNNFADRMRVEKPRMAVTLKSVQPELTGPATISIKLNNRDQLEDFMSSTKAELEKYLRQELQNDLIAVDAGLLEPSGPTQVRLYTSEEKFKYLSTKNPVLSKFRQNLNLELE
jgi:DNA polymerase-3 subunit gamma/tau